MIGFTVCNPRVAGHRRASLSLCHRRSRQARWMAVSDMALVEQDRLQRVHDTWTWNGYNINSKTMGPEDAELQVLLVHGFGASVNHWIKLQSALAMDGLRVHSVDLLGFGASDKPPEESYSIELWSDLVASYVREKGGRWLIAGNSVGSLVSMNAAKELGDSTVAGLCLFNCAGGLTAFRYSELSPPLRVVYFLLRKILFNPLVGKLVFSSYRSRDNIKSILSQVYINQDAVTDELVEMLYLPSEDPNATSVFLKILDGPPGPTPEGLLRELTWCPVLAVWGNDDPWTPLSADQGLNFHPGDKFGDYHPQYDLVRLANVGHCPMDESPEDCRRSLLEWLQKTSIVEPSDQQASIVEPSDQKTSIVEPSDQE